MGVSLFQYATGARRSDCRDDRSGFMEVLRCDVRAGEMLGINLVRRGSRDICEQDM